LPSPPPPPPPPPRPADPTRAADRPSALRDLGGVILIVALAAVLLPTWMPGDGEFLQRGEDVERTEAQRLIGNVGSYVANLAEQMLTRRLLLALGLLLALRARCIDLSVWSVSWLGGVLAAELILAGLPPGRAILYAAAAGLGIGAVSGVCVAVVRIPSVVVTGAVAAAALLGAQHVGGATRGVIRIPETAFDDWTARAQMSLGRIQMLLVAAIYSVVLGAMAAASSVRSMREWHWRPGRRSGVWAALTISGALSATCGALGLLASSAAPIPVRPIEDLRPIAAVLLAGGAFFAGRGRSMLAAIALPASLLLATIWRQRVWLLQWDVFYVQVILLAAMVVAAHAAISLAARPGRLHRGAGALAALLAAGGLLTLAATANIENFRTRDTLHTVALALAAGGAGLTLLASLTTRRRETRMTDRI